MMKPATRYLLLPLLLTVATGAEPLREISTWTRQPDTCEKRELIARRNALIVASCIAGVLVAVVVAIVILLWMAIAFM